MKMFKKIIFIAILTIFILSIVNALDESENPAYVLMVSLLAVIPPVLSTCVVFFIREKVRRPKIVQICAYIVAAVGLFFYIAYATNGPSDPDTAGHMHVVLFPMVYGLFSFFIMMGGIVISFIDKNPVKQNHQK